MQKDSRLEIQIHPSDIRRSVRYLFLSRKQLIIGGAAVFAYLLFIGWSLSVAPGVLYELLQRSRYATLEGERESVRPDLQAHASEMTELRKRADHLYLQVQHIQMAYGLKVDESIGQGGYPIEPRQAPESIYRGVIQRGYVLEARIEERLEVVETLLEEIGSFEQSHREQVAQTPTVSPLERDDFVLTSPFGYRQNPFTKARDFHHGIDMAAPEGTTIKAAAAGVVTFAGRYRLRSSVHWWRYGNLVVLRHGDEFVTLYAHCHEVRVQRGQRVQRGDIIATVGSTGWSTSPHLHYEVRRLSEESSGGEPVDPRIYMLDQELVDREKLLVASRTAPAFEDFEPLPRNIAR